MKDYDEQFSPSQDEIEDQMPEPSEEGFQADGRWGYLRDEEYVEVVLHNQLPLYGDICNNCGENYAECYCAAKRDFERQQYRNADREEWRHEAAEQQRLK